MVSWDRRMGSLDLAPRGRSRRGHRALPSLLCPSGTKQPEPSVPRPQTLLFLLPRDQHLPHPHGSASPAAQQHCGSAAVQGDAKGLCGGFNGNGTPRARPPHGQAPQRDKGAGCGQGCSPAGSTDEPSTAQWVPREPPTPQQPLARFPNPPSWVSGCWRRAGAPGQQGEGIPQGWRGQDAVPRTAHVRPLAAPSQLQEAGKEPREVSPGGATSSQHPQGMQETDSRGLCMCWHEWPGSCVAAGRPPMPCGARRCRSRVAKCCRVGSSTQLPYVREREHGGDRSWFVGQKMEVRGS